MPQAKNCFIFPALILSASCSAAPSQEFYELHYGTTRYLPMRDELAADYIDDDTDVVPATLKRCGAQFLAFNGQITDGGEAAYFALPSGDSKAKACIKQALPQGDLRPASADVVRLLHTRKRPAPEKPA